SVVGFLGFDSVRKHKEWSEDTISLLKIVSEIFASAMERKRVDAALRRAKDELEIRVERRTQQLAEMNRVLEEGIKVRNIEIFERRRAEQALKESEERYKDILEHATDLIMSVSPAGALLFVNSAFRETLGYSETAVKGLTIFDIVPDSKRAACWEIFRQAMAGEYVEKFETEFVTSGASKIIVEGGISCKFVEDKPVSMRCIFRDITHRKEIER